MLVTQIAVLLESFVDDSLEVCRQAGIQSNRRHGIAVQDGVENSCRALSPKRQLPRAHLVQDRSEREQIGIEFLRSRLFWRHIRHSSQGAAWTGQVVRIQIIRDKRLRIPKGLCIGTDLGQAEV